MLYSHDLKLILVNNWKCGCSSIADIFDRHLDDRGRPSYHNQAHWPAFKIKDYFDSNGWEFSQYRVISSVRDPWERAVSLYEHLVRDRPYYKPPFPAFLKEELPRWRSGAINRWDTKEMFEIDGQRVVDHVVKLESLEEDLRRIIKGYPYWSSLAFAPLTMRSNAHEHAPADTYYTEQWMIDSVAEHFAYDREEFNYPMMTLTNRASADVELSDGLDG